jgi:transcriptional regulator of arginine metabolism
MSDLKGRRQRAITGLIRSRVLTSQEELAEQLSSLGFAATQATISRDLDQIGAVKIRREGQLGYALSDDARDGRGTRLSTVFREWVRSVEPAGNLVVIKAPPGSAQLIGFALDHSNLTEIVGTICGDDTTFVACRSIAEAEALASKLSGELQ